MKDDEHDVIPKRRRPRSVVILVGLLSVSACVDGSGPIPRDIVELEVDLPPGATETYEFDIEAETFGISDSVLLRMSPQPVSLRSSGITVEQSWTHEGVDETGWPDLIDVDQDERVLAILTLRLTNEGQIRIDEKLTIIITSGGDIPEPSEEELRVEIRQR